MDSDRATASEAMHPPASTAFDESK